MNDERITVRVTATGQTLDVAVFSKGWVTMYAYEWHATSFDVVP